MPFLSPSNIRLLTSWFGLVLFVVSLAGCGAEKESLHEHDHVEPAHWPSDMFEAADFIEQRLAALKDTASQEATSEQRAVLLDELTDLVEWSPEVAADTDLPEAQWTPIYDLSEAIRGHLGAGDIEPDLIASDFERLTSLLRDAGDVAARLDAGRMDAMATGEPIESDSEIHSDGETDSKTDNESAE